MYRPIVCAVDESAAAREAAAVAGVVAAHLDARLVLAHAARSSTGAARALKGAGAEVVTGVDVELACRRGPAPEFIAAMAEETDAQLVVAGSRRSGPLRAALMGSTSQSIVRHVSRPVLLVPTGSSESFARALRLAGASVVCGFDGSQESAAALQFAERLADHLQLRLVVVHAWRPPTTSAAIPPGGVAVPVDPAAGRDERRRQARRILGQAETVLTEAEPETALEVGDAVEQLQRESDAEGAAVIAVGASSRSRLAALLRGSVWARLPRVATVPVLVVPADGDGRS